MLTAWGAPIPIATLTTIMPTDPKLLTLAQWLSPAFPTGAFAFSHGLETAIHEGWVRDAQTLQDWLRDCLTDGAARSDAIWLRLAYAAEDPNVVDQRARTFSQSRERLREAERQGAAFVTTANAVFDFKIPALLLPVAVGRAAKLAEVDLDDAVALYLQGFVTNLVSAAQRLSPIGQTAGQRVIAALQPTCLQVTAEIQGADETAIHGNTFLSDIAAMRHETLEPRLFQS